MKVFYTDFSKFVGFNYKNHKKPFYLLDNVYFIVECDDGSRIREKIEKGFESDGTTLLKIFFFLLGCSHNPQYLPAAIIHDWIMKYPEVVNRNRKLSSRILRQALMNEGVVRWKIEIMYYGVEFYQWAKNFFIKKWV